MFGMMRSPAQSYQKVGLEVAVDTASPHKLILMLFDGAVAAVNIAKFEMESGEIAKKGASISKAIDIITNGLRGSLDMNEGEELAERLAALYEYMAQRLLFANLKNSTAALDEVLELLNSLRSAWEQINPDQQAAA